MGRDGTPKGMKTHNSARNRDREEAGVFGRAVEQSGHVIP
jgi:hypothetical protein